MPVTDNMLYELENQSSLILQKITETSYGVSTHDLWELLGSIKYITESNLAIIGELKQEVNPEQVEIESDTDDAITMDLKVTDVKLPNV
jgi:hypothetical protein